MINGSGLWRNQDSLVVDSGTYGVGSLMIQNHGRIDVDGQLALAGSRSMQNTSAMLVNAPGAEIVFASSCLKLSGAIGVDNSGILQCAGIVDSWVLDSAVQVVNTGSMDVGMKDFFGNLVNHGNFSLRNGRIDTHDPAFTGWTSQNLHRMSAVQGAYQTTDMSGRDSNAPPENYDFYGLGNSFYGLTSQDQEREDIGYSIHLARTLLYSSVISLENLEGTTNSAAQKQSHGSLDGPTEEQVMRTRSREEFPVPDRFVEHLSSTKTFHRTGILADAGSVEYHRFMAAGVARKLGDREQDQRRRNVLIDGSKDDYADAWLTDEDPPLGSSSQNANHSMSASVFDPFEEPDIMHMVDYDDPQDDMGSTHNIRHEEDRSNITARGYSQSIHDNGNHTRIAQEYGFYYYNDKLGHMQRADNQDGVRICLNLTDGYIYVWNVEDGRWESTDHTEPTPELMDLYVSNGTAVDVAREYLYYSQLDYFRYYHAMQDVALEMDFGIDLEDDASISDPDDNMTFGYDSDGQELPDVVGTAKVDSTGAPEVSGRRRRLTGTINGDMYFGSFESGSSAPQYSVENTGEMILEHYFTGHHTNTGRMYFRSALANTGKLTLCIQGKTGHYNEHWIHMQGGGTSLVDAPLDFNTCDYYGAGGHGYRRIQFSMNSFVWEAPQVRRDRNWRVHFDSDWVSTTQFRLGSSAVDVMLEPSTYVSTGSTVYVRGRSVSTGGLEVRNSGSTVDIHSSSSADIGGNVYLNDRCSLTIVGLGLIHVTHAVNLHDRDRLIMVGDEVRVGHGVAARTLCTAQLNSSSSVEVGHGLTATGTSVVDIYGHNGRVRVGSAMSVSGTSTVNIASLGNNESSSSEVGQGLTISGSSAVTIQSASSSNVTKYLHISGRSTINNEELALSASDSSTVRIGINDSSSMVIGTQGVVDVGGMVDITSSSDVYFTGNRNITLGGYGVSTCLRSQSNGVVRFGAQSHVLLNSYIDLEGSMIELDEEVTISGSPMGEINPLDSARKSSSVWNNDAAGTGNNQGRLSSPLGWMADDSESYPLECGVLGFDEIQCSASSQSSSSHTCTNAFDSSSPSEWRTHNEGIGAWIQVQFRRNITIGSMQFVNMCGVGASSRSQALVIAFSDGSTQHVNNVPNDCSTATYSLSAVRTSYVNITISALHGGHQHDESISSSVTAGVQRICFFSPDNEAATVAEGWLENNLSWTANDPSYRSSVYSNSYPPENALNDRDVGSAWHSGRGRHNQWVAFDFRTNVTLSAIATRGNPSWPTGYQFRSFAFQAAETLSGPWVAVYSGTGARTVASQVFEFPEYRAACWRLMMYNNHDNGVWFSLGAINFYASDKSADAGDDIAKWRTTRPQPSWHEMDAGSVRSIHGVVTQGHAVPGKYGGHVTGYTVQASNDGANWTQVDDGRVFLGNVDASTFKVSEFDVAVIARYIRICPEMWTLRIALRAGLLTHGGGSLGITYPQQSASSVEFNPPYDRRHATEAAYRDRQGYRYNTGRLDSPEAWLSSRSDWGRWHQMDLDIERVVSGVVIQPRRGSSQQRVTTFCVYAHFDGGWKWVDNMAIFPGNSVHAPSDERAYAYFESPILTRYVRIYPKSWHRRMSMRVGVQLYQSADADERIYDEMAYHRLAAHLHLESRAILDLSSSVQILRWESGKISGSQDAVISLDTWEIANSDRVYLAGVTMMLRGNTTWTGFGLIFAENKTIIVNSANSVFDIQTDAFIFWGIANSNASSLGTQFINEGHVQKSRGYTPTTYITAEYTSAGGTVDSNVIFIGNVSDSAFKPRLWNSDVSGGGIIGDWSDPLNWLPPRPPSPDAVVYVEDAGMLGRRMLNPDDSARNASSVYANHGAGTGYNRGSLDSPTGWLAKGVSNAPVVLVDNWHSLDGEYGIPMYYIFDSICVVYGRVRSGGWGELAQLPVQCRPDKRLIFNVNNHAQTSRVDVQTDGIVRWVAGGRSHGWISVSGIFFRTTGASWHMVPLPLLNNWENYGGEYGTATYTLEDNKFCTVEGLVNGTVAWQAGGDHWSWLSLTGIAFATVAADQAAIYEWHQLDVGFVTSIVGIVTQGQADSDAWVTAFRVSASYNGSSWIDVDDAAMFQGNSDRNTQKTSLFSALVTARYIRIYPTSFHGQIGLRAGVLVCAGCIRFPSGHTETNVLFLGGPQSSPHIVIPANATVKISGLAVIKGGSSLKLSGTLSSFDTLWVNGEVQGDGAWTTHNRLSVESGAYNVGSLMIQNRGRIDVDGQLALAGSRSMQNTSAMLVNAPGAEIVFASSCLKLSGAIGVDNSGILQCAGIVDSWALDSAVQVVNTGSMDVGMKDFFGNLVNHGNFSLRNGRIDTHDAAFTGWIERNSGRIPTDDWRQRDFTADTIGPSSDAFYGLDVDTFYGLHVMDDVRSISPPLMTHSQRFGGLLESSSRRGNKNSRHTRRQLHTAEKDSTEPVDTTGQSTFENGAIDKDHTEPYLTDEPSSAVGDTLTAASADSLADSDKDDNLVARSSVFDPYYEEPDMVRMVEYFGNSEGELYQEQDQFQDSSDMDSDSIISDNGNDTRIAQEYGFYYYNDKLGHMQKAENQDGVWICLNLTDGYIYVWNVEDGRWESTDHTEPTPELTDLYASNGTAVDVAREYLYYSQLDYFRYYHAMQDVALEMDYDIDLEDDASISDPDDNMTFGYDSDGQELPDFVGTAKVDSTGAPEVSGRRRRLTGTINGDMYFGSFESGSSAPQYSVENTGEMILEHYFTGHHTNTGRMYFRSALANTGKLTLCIQGKTGHYNEHWIHMQGGGTSLVDAPLDFNTCDYYGAGGHGYRRIQFSMNSFVWEAPQVRRDRNWRVHFDSDWVSTTQFRLGSSAVDAMLEPSTYVSTGSTVYVRGRSVSTGGLEVRNSGSTVDIHSSSSADIGGNVYLNDRCSLTIVGLGLIHVTHAVNLHDRDRLIMVGDEVRVGHGVAARTLCTAQLNSSSSVEVGHGLTATGTSVVDIYGHNGRVRVGSAMSVSGTSTVNIASLGNNESSSSEVGQGLTISGSSAVTIQSASSSNVTKYLHISGRSTINVSSGGNTTVGAAMSVSGSSALTVHSGGNTTVGAAMSVSSSSALTVHSGGNTTVGAAMSVSSSSALTVHSGGNTTVGAAMSVSSSSTLTALSGGSMVIGGRLSAAGGSGLSVESGSETTLGEDLIASGGSTVHLECDVVCIHCDRLMSTVRSFGHRRNVNSQNEELALSASDSSTVRIGINDSSSMVIGTQGVVDVGGMVDITSSSDVYFTGNRNITLGGYGVSTCLRSQSNGVVRFGAQSHVLLNSYIDLEGSMIELDEEVTISGSPMGEINPLDSARKSSSVWNNDAAGTGNNQGRLSSPLGWMADDSESYPLECGVLGFDEIQCSASSQSSSSHTCTNAFDSSSPSEWRTHNEGIGAWIQVQFRRNITIGSMQFVNMCGVGASSRSQALVIAFSDGSTQHVNNVPNDCSTATYSLSAVRTSYVNITISALHGGHQHDESISSSVTAGVQRICFFSPDNEAATVAEGWLENNLSWTANDPSYRSSVYSNSYPPENALNDRDVGSAWHSGRGRHNQWVAFDFRTNVTLSAIATRGNPSWPTGYQFRSFAFQAAETLSGPWVAVYSGTGARTVASQVFEFPEYRAACWRLMMYNNHDNGVWFSLGAINFYASDKSADAGDDIAKWRTTRPQPSWHEMDAGSVRSIHGVVTQGHAVPGKYGGHVTGYTVQASNDGANWTQVDDGRVFLGNVDASTFKVSEFDVAVIARYIRICPEMWTLRIALRAGLLTHGGGSLGITYPQQSASSVEFNPPYDRRHATEAAYRDRQGYRYNTGRLDSPEAWLSSRSDWGRWHQMDLDIERVVSGVVIQPRRGSSQQRVTTFCVYAHFDGGWKWVDNMAIFPGNSVHAPSDERAYAYFESPILTRYVRIYPKSWHRRMSMRVGVQLYQSADADERIYDEMAYHRLAAHLHLESRAILDLSSSVQILRWESGKISGSQDAVISLDTWEIANSDRVYLAGVTMMLRGNTTWTGFGLIFAENKTIIVNSANSVFDIQTDAFIFWGIANSNASSLGTQFINEGHVQKSRGYTPTTYITAEYTSAGGTVDSNVIFIGNVSDSAFKPRLWNSDVSGGGIIGDWSDPLNWLPPRPPSPDAVVYVEDAGMLGRRMLNPDDSARNASSVYANHGAGTGYNRGSLDSPTGWLAKGVSNAPVVLVDNWHSLDGEYGIPMYYIFDSICVVYGRVRSGGWGELAQLPVQCRPDKRLIFNVNNHAQTSRVDVQTDGIVRWVAGGRSHGWISVSGIFFRTTGASWHTVPLPLLNNWENYGGEYGTATYTLEDNKFCTVEGLVRPGVWGHLAQLPLECRPSNRLIFNLHCNAYTARVDVQVNGTVAWQAGGDHWSWLSLTGIAFATVAADQAAIYEWHQLDVGFVTSIVGIVTQGQADSDAWVTAFRVSASYNGSSWIDVDDAAMFQGNSDRNTQKTSLFSALVTARYIRIYPTSFHGQIGLRAGVLVCAGCIRFPSGHTETNVLFLGGPQSSPHIVIPANATVKISGLAVIKGGSSLKLSGTLSSFDTLWVNGEVQGDGAWTTHNRLSVESGAYNVGSLMIQNRGRIDVDGQLALAGSRSMQNTSAMLVNAPGAEIVFASSCLKLSGAIGVDNSGILQCAGIVDSWALDSAVQVVNTGSMDVGMKDFFGNLVNHGNFSLRNGRIDTHDAAFTGWIERNSGRIPTDDWRQRDFTADTIGPSSDAFYGLDVDTFYGLHVMDDVRSISPPLMTHSQRFGGLLESSSRRGNKNSRHTRRQLHTAEKDSTEPVDTTGQSTFENGAIDKDHTEPYLTDEPSSAVGDTLTAASADSLADSDKDDNLVARSSVFDPYYEEPDMVRMVEYFGNSEGELYQEQDQFQDSSDMDSDSIISDNGNDTRIAQEYGFYYYNDKLGHMQKAENQDGVWICLNLTDGYIYVWNVEDGRWESTDHTEPTPELTDLYASNGTAVDVAREYLYYSQLDYFRYYHAMQDVALEMDYDIDLEDDASISDPDDNMTFGYDSDGQELPDFVGTAKVDSTGAPEVSGRRRRLTGTINGDMYFGSFESGSSAPQYSVENTGEMILEHYFTGHHTNTGRMYFRSALANTGKLTLCIQGKTGHYNEHWIHMQGGGTSLVDAPLDFNTCDYYGAGGHGYRRIQFSMNSFVWEAPQVRRDRNWRVHFDSDWVSTTQFRLGSSAVDVMLEPSTYVSTGSTVYVRGRSVSTGGLEVRNSGSTVDIHSSSSADIGGNVYLNDRCSLTIVGLGLIHVTHAVNLHDRDRLIMVGDEVRVGHGVAARTLCTAQLNSSSSVEVGHGLTATGTSVVDIYGHNGRVRVGSAMSVSGTSTVNIASLGNNESSSSEVGQGLTISGSSAVTIQSASSSNVTKYLHISGRSTINNEELALSASDSSTVRIGINDSSSMVIGTQGVVDVGGMVDITSSSDVYFTGNRNITLGGYGVSTCLRSQSNGVVRFGAQSHVLLNSYIDLEGSMIELDEEVTISGSPMGEINPLDSARKSSSVWNNDAAGTGNNQGRLSSPLGWMADDSESYPLECGVLGFDEIQCSASSQSSSSHTCTNAFDSSSPSEWRTHNEGIGAWIQVQFRRNITIGSMQFVNMCGVGASSRSQALVIAFSDGSTQHVNNVPNDCSTATYSLSAVRTSYVNITISALHGGHQHDESISSSVTAGVQRICFFSPDDEAATVAEGWLENNLSWTANDPSYRSGVYSNSYPPENVLNDRDVGSAWHSGRGRHNQWVAFDFRTNVTLSAIATRGNPSWPTGYQFRSFAFQAAETLSGPWVAVYSGTGARTVASQVFEFPEYHAACWRLMMYNNHDNGVWFSLGAINFYASDKSADAGDDIAKWRTTRPQPSWHEMDAGSVRSIHGVVTQGHAVPGKYGGHVTGYTVQASNDGANWTQVDDGRVFLGNVDASTFKVSEFDVAVIARYIRICPEMWTLRIALRAGLLTHGGGSLGITYPQQSASSVEFNPPYDRRHATEAAYRDRQGYRYNTGRLDSPEAWLSSRSDWGRWHQMDLDIERVVSGVVIQPRRGSSQQRVTTFCVYAHFDGGWKWVDNMAIFPGNSVHAPSDERAYAYFESPILTRYVRIYPKSWHRRMSMRVGVQLYQSADADERIYVREEVFLEGEPRGPGGHDDRLFRRNGGRQTTVEAVGSWSREVEKGLLMGWRRLPQGDGGGGGGGMVGAGDVGLVGRRGRWCGWSGGWGVGGKRGGVEEPHLSLRLEVSEAGPGVRVLQLRGSGRKRRAARAGWWAERGGAVVCPVDGCTVGRLASRRALTEHFRRCHPDASNRLLSVEGLTRCPEASCGAILAETGMRQHRSRGGGCAAGVAQRCEPVRVEGEGGGVMGGSGSRRTLGGGGDCPSLMVPKRLRGLFTECVMVALARMRVDPEDLEAYKLFFLVPRLVLQSVPLGLKKAGEGGAAGECGEKAGVGQAGSGDGGDPALRRLEQLHQAGTGRRQEVEGDRRRELQEQAIKLDGRVFDDVMRNVPRASGPGSSQWRWDYWDHLWVVHVSGGRDALLEVCNHLAAGRVPEGMREWLGEGSGGLRGGGELGGGGGLGGGSGERGEVVAVVGVEEEVGPLTHQSLSPLPAVMERVR
ncbi:hypothetical protein CYMTET_38854 [Cymbomonas tetramitiformis]|uniref:F5/8 type C domain-containing protein n=1 Tax=Cymbomonas tetramitiformis TaxID=36881 RepID=A0AAE0F4V1_9CHLO|nr:hypothetical protein CYMTET_38854 [Cymbomonas tetramitiformis]